MTAEPILIWGGGAIGGTIGAYWARAGIPVLLVDIVEAHVEACRDRGLHISGPIEDFIVRVPASTPAELSGQFSRIVLAVKAQATEAALQQLAPHLAADGYVLSAQNGLNEIAIARAVGRRPHHGLLRQFRRRLARPRRDPLRQPRRGRRRRDRRRPTPTNPRDARQPAAAFEPDAILTDNIWGYLWGKLAYGAMLFATALTQDSMSVNFADPRRTVVFDQLGREVMAVAAARGVTPVGFGEFEPQAFLPGSEPAAGRAVIAWLADYTAQSAKTHSGIYRDLAVRKRRTEVDPQIGIIATLGREAGVATPALTRLVALIHDIEDGRRPMSFETFERLIDACTSASTAASPS